MVALQCREVRGKLLVAKWISRPVTVMELPLPIDRQHCKERPRSYVQPQHPKQLMTLDELVNRESQHEVDLRLLPSLCAAQGQVASMSIGRQVRPAAIQCGKLNRGQKAFCSRTAILTPKVSIKHP